MSHERNNETQKSLQDELKALKDACIKTYHVIENAPPDAPVVNPEEVNDKVNCYIKGLEAEIKNTNSLSSTDDNLLTSQFLSEIKEKNGQLNQLTAYTKGTIHDLDVEINRLKTCISIAKEAQSKPKILKQVVRPEHLQKAREKFVILKNEIQGLMQSLFPHCHEAMKEVMGELMAAKLNNIGDGYLPVMSENYQLIEQLKDMNIVTTNPYNNMEVKLTF